MKQLIDSEANYFLSDEIRLITDAIESGNLTTAAEIDAYIKAGYRLVRTLRIAARQEKELEKKLEYHRALLKIDSSLTKVSAFYDTLQQAAELAATAEFCESCGEQLPHGIITCG